MDEILFTHICEVIFKNTNDLIILEKLKRVNILWKNSIDKILETSDIWKRACLNEIPSEPIPFMITRFFPMVHFENYHELDDLKVWRTVYFSYRKWKILSKLRVSVEVSYQPAVISNRPEGIWAFASNDKYFAVGNSRGIIYLFDFNRLNEPVQTINFEKIIKNIKFWSPASGDLFIVARIEPGNIKFWNVSAMTEVECINSNDDTRIDVLCTGSPNILFTINNRRLYEYKHTTDGIRLYRIDNLQLPLRTVTGSVENDKIIYVSTDEDSVTFYNYRNQTSYGNHNIIEEDHQIFPAWSNNNIHPYDSPTFVFLSSNVILQAIAKENSCLLIYNQRTNWTMHKPFESSGYSNLVTAGILHGKLLILGFKTGHVRIYTIENIESLKTSKLDLNSGIEYLLSNEEILPDIVRLEVAETQGKLIILARTAFVVHSINFFPNNNPQ